jgi:hypothetical protein
LWFGVHFKFYVAFADYDSYDLSITGSNWEDLPYGCFNLRNGFYAVAYLGRGRKAIISGGIRYKQYAFLSHF